jgi:hypothetical protein
MKILLTNNVTTGTVTLGGSAWTPKVMQWGEEVTIGLQLQRTVDGQEVDWYPTINGLQAAIGATDARPAGGDFKVKLGNDPSSAANTTAALQWNATAAEWKAAINALTDMVALYGAAETWAVDGSVFMRFANGVQVPITIVRNRLWPISFGRVNAYLHGETWVHEVRLTQAPVAWTNAQERVLPPQPTITRVQAGGAESEMTWNEIQALSVPVDFKGAYQIRRDYVRGELLSRADGAEQIAAAISALGAFKVTNPLPNTANIEFVNDDGGQAQDLLEVVVFSAPPGDVTFSLRLDREELWAMLRHAPVVTLPLHVRIRATEDEVTSTFDAFVVPITIRRPVIFDDMEEVQEIDWLRPPSPRDYRGYDPSTVINGTGQFFPALIGDGEATEFPIAHNFGTTLIANVEISDRETGELLARGTDYRVRIDSDNQVTVYGFAEIPTLEQYQMVLFCAGPQSAFVAGLTVNISQVNGLVAWMEDAAGEIAALKALAPGDLAALTDPDGETIVIPIPGRKEIWYGRVPVDFEMPGADQWDTAVWPKPAPALLPAIHTDSTDLFGGGDLPDPLDEIGTVLLNSTGAVLELDGGDGVRPGVVPVDGYLGSDGRAWYPLTKAPDKNSFFPTQMEREIFQFALQDGMLRNGTVLEITGELMARVARATTWVQTVLVVEIGEISSDAEPDPTAENLEGIAWNVAQPVLEHDIRLSDMRGPGHTFGVRIARAKDGAFTAQGMRYKVWTAAASVPDSHIFAIRARLKNFDTRDSETGERGWVIAQFTGEGHIF